MSRCVPFPPPGYVWNGVGEEALVDLLKVRQEKAQAEKQRRKEKRKRNKEKTKKKKESEVIECRKRHNNGRIEKIHESQGLESSSLTEETSTSQYDSSDNTQNIEKIKPNSYHRDNVIQRTDCELGFRELVVNWVPPTQCYCNTDFDDQDWLFDRKLPRHGRTEKFEAAIDDLCPRSLTSSSSTCATYLPQADVHVLPFTLLF